MSSDSGRPAGANDRTPNASAAGAERNAAETGSTRGDDATGGLRFNSFRIHLARREIWLGAEIQPVAPLVFNLLAFLIEHRHRVVSKAELVDAIWGGASVSDGAIARAVSKARKAIGDLGETTALIKTVHRVGYRFAVEPAPSPPSAVVADRPPSLRLALLPFQNHTGDAHAAWIELGLLALVTRAVEADPRLNVIALSSLQQALGALPLGLSVHDRCAAVIRLVGADCVVQAAVRRAGGHYRIDYECHGRIQTQGSLRGPEITELGRRLAMTIEESLFAGDRRPVGFESSDPLANQIYARAVEVSHRGEWGAAARMLAVVLDIDPSNRAAKLQQLRMLSNLHDDSAIAVGERLIETLRAEGDSTTLASAHEIQAITLYKLSAPDAAERSAWHIEEALRMAGPHADGDWVARLYLGVAILAHVRAEQDRAIDYYERAERASQNVPNQVRRAAILGNLAECQAMAGRPLLARPTAEAALRIARLHDLPASIVHVLCVLAGIEHSLGMMSSAQTLLSEAVSRLPALPPYDPEAAAWVLVGCGKLQADLRGGEPLAGSFAYAAAMRQRAEPRMTMALRMANGFSALAQDDAEGALRLMREATDAAAALGVCNVHHDFLCWLLESTMRCHGAESPQAGGLRGEIAALPAFAVDDTLRGHVMRAESAALHAQGQDAAACRGLDATVLATPIGRVNALARLDAAWLHLEAGRDAAARALLRDMGPWLHEHPMGLVALSRQKLAQGRIDDARDALQRGLKGMSRVPAELARWLDGLEGASAPGEAMPARLSRMLSLF